MLMEINYVILDDILSSVSEQRKLLNEKITEEELQVKGEAKFISDDISIYKLENTLYIFLKDIETIDSLIAILKDKDLYKDINSIVLSYKKSIEYKINEQKLQLILRKVVNDINRFTLKLLANYQKEEAKLLSRIAILSDEYKETIKNNKEVDTNDFVKYLLEGIENLKTKAKKLQLNMQKVVNNFIKKIFSSKEKID